MTTMRKALGLMSGTSLDGVDVASIVTDGRKVERFGATLTVPYEPDLREAIRVCLGTETWSQEIREVESRLTDFHAKAVAAWAESSGEAVDSIDVVGFHGQTIFHRPGAGRTWQLGDGQRLADALGLPVVFDFRSNDVAAGGEGAPLVPIFHAALAVGLQRPVAIVNIGGVANVTWVGDGDDLVAFDTGPGNAPIDDLTTTAGVGPFDADGALAARGTVDEAAVQAFATAEFFLRKPPKSLDRNELSSLLKVKGELENDAATLTMCTAKAISLSSQWFANYPSQWVLCGGGSRNATMVRYLRSLVHTPVVLAEDLGWNGDAIEAQAFAFLAVRTLEALPISFPGTTGVTRPLIGGAVVRPRR
jgi:anhydro-N-acetylmuramic acid kinase